MYFVTLTESEHAILPKLNFVFENQKDWTNLVTGKLMLSGAFFFYFSFFHS
jgi:hypothetical protein